jgi:hypothetical protein
MTIDLNNLSDEVLFYSNDQFYKFIEENIGVDEMMLIKLQSIKSSRTLINVPDVLAILSFKCKEIVELKNRICFIDEDDDKNFVVKSGIKTNIIDLITALKEKNNKHIKRKKNSKSSSPKLNDLQSNTSSSNVSSLDSNESQLTPVLSTAPTFMSTNHYIQLISDSIEKFSLHTFENIILKNNIDYVICLTILGAEINGCIKCGCNTTIKISFRSKSKSFQLSAYLKHLINTRCCMIKRKKQGLDKVHGIMNKLSDTILQDNDCSNIDDVNDFDEEDLINQNDSSQTTTNISTRSSSNSSGNKRSLPPPSTSSTTKRTKPS